MSEQSKAPDVVFRRVEYDKMTKRARVLFCRESKPGADEAEYVSRDLCDALVEVAFECAAKCSYHNPSKEPDYPYDERGALKRSYRDDFGDVKDPDGFAGQIALHDAWQAAQDILALTPTDAQAAYDAAIAAARAEGYAKALKDAAQQFTKDETYTGCVVLHRLEKLKGESDG